MLHPTGSCPVPAFPPITPPAHFAFPSALCHSAPWDQTPFSHHAGDVLFATNSLGAVFANSAQKGFSQSAQPHIPHPAAGSAPPGYAMQLVAPAALSNGNSLPLKPLLQEPQCTFKMSPMTSPFSWVLHSSSLDSWSSSIEIFPCRISIFSSEHFWGQKWD